MNIEPRPSYLVAKASVALATKLFRDYRKMFSSALELFLILSNVRKKASIVPQVLV